MRLRVGFDCRKATLYKAQEKKQNNYYQIRKATFLRTFIAQAALRPIWVKANLVPGLAMGLRTRLTYAIVAHQPWGWAVPGRGLVSIGAHYQGVVPRLSNLCNESS